MPEQLTETPLGCLAADLEQGLSAVRLAAHAGDPWFAARNRAKARQAYEAAVRLKERIEADLDGRADLLRQLEQLRRAIQAA